MASLNAPKIVSSRGQYADSHTLARFLETDGYVGLKKALTMHPEEVAAEVDAASLLGRGGAGFPAGRKWSMLRKSPISYLVVNGDESEPATFKDHFLVERDPNQLVEGVIIAAYALQVTQEVSLDRAWNAANAALKNLGLPVTATQKDGLAGRLEARNAQNQPVIIKLTRQTDTATKIEISVGTFDSAANRTEARLIYDRMKEKF